MILKRTELLENETQNNLEKVDQNRTELREIPYFSKILVNCTFVNAYRDI